MINYLNDMSPEDFGRTCSITFQDGTTHTGCTLAEVSPTEGILEYTMTENAVLLERVARIGDIRFIAFVPAA
jgi:hypothetical protein